MRQKSGPVKELAEQIVRDIRRATRRHFSAEDKIRIVLEGLRGEDSIAGLCRSGVGAHCSEAPWVLDGPINGESFRTYVDQVLAPTLKPGDVVILDNLGSHKGKAVRRAIRPSGARLLFLPPYSPDLNPIEQVFAKLKHLMRKAKERRMRAKLSGVHLIEHLLYDRDPT
jgi:transposase